MLPRGFTTQPTRAENAVLDAVADILVDRLCDARTEGRVGRSSPLLIHVDGRGRTLFLDKVGRRLERGYKDGDTPQDNGDCDHWTVIRFDAWQHQRVPPPWWWLIRAIDSELRSRAVGWWGRLRQRKKDWGWRIGLLFKDVGNFLLVPLVAGLIAGLAWILSGQNAVVDALQWAATVVAALTAIVGVAWSGTNALRRHLLLESPAGATAVLRVSDPMAEVRRRYAFLIQSAGTPVAILIDNLDRCRAEYVVELLEGLQTLLKQHDKDAKNEHPMVTYVVAADRDWLCDSYLHVYEEFQETAQEPGRPFGLAFLDKIFNLSLRIPRVPASVSRAADASDDFAAYLSDPTSVRGSDEISRAESELAVRKGLHAAEHKKGAGRHQPAVPRYGLRLWAVRSLAELERKSKSKMGMDTEEALRELTESLEPGPIVVRHLYSAYCVQRTVQLLAGHEVDHEPTAIKRLGLWTLLSLRWPLLAEHLERSPSHLEAIGDGPAPEEVDERLAQVFRLPEVERLASLAATIRLDAETIRRFTLPIGMRQPQQTARPAHSLNREQVVP